ncbi:integrase family protein (plasmid) [Gloeothece citriformis PCC 7424]|uniref:Integrase family protein n=1 Tax=Gloeothece citriformis (strain PCC 7424) TaxID=65393 RepID=B7KMU2_GLOC7|nr:tyrosine-type recombinase/integrase [Gloeothece citriformis]ACK74114.1 integrase family protein [Gloeothece citriformis PCC 7424]
MTKHLTETSPVEITLKQASERLLEMWLDGHSPHTVDSYRRSARRFLDFVNKPLHLVTLADLQLWRASLTHLAPSSQGTAMAAIKSLLSFGHQIGVLPTNVGIALKSPKVKDTLNERILNEEEVMTMIANEPDERNRVLLRLLYAGGLRVSELCALKWKDLKSRNQSGQVTVFGKGGKTRTVLLPSGVWQELCQIRGKSRGADPVFPSRMGGGHLDRTQVYRIVKAAASRAGIEGNVSPHWLRHAHASHSLDRGAPLHLVQATLGHSSVATTERYLHARPNDSSAMYLPE